LRRRRTRRDNLLLCSYKLASIDVDGSSEDVGLADDRQPFSSIDNDEIERLPFSKRRSPLESDSSIV
jgi:hypothetical protein